MTPSESIQVRVYSLEYTMAKLYEEKVLIHQPPKKPATSISGHLLAALPAVLSRRVCGRCGYETTRSMTRIKAVFRHSLETLQKTQPTKRALMAQQEGEAVQVCLAEQLNLSQLLQQCCQMSTNPHLSQNLQHGELYYFQHSHQEKMFALQVSAGEMLHVGVSESEICDINTCNMSLISRFQKCTMKRG